MIWQMQEKQRRFMVGHNADGPVKALLMNSVKELDDMTFASQIRVSKTESIQACKVNNIVVIATGQIGLAFPPHTN